MTLSDLQQLLAQLDLSPSKQLGQNFLIDRNLAQWITRQLDPAAGATIVEVGPGTGALTESLVETASHLLLIEMDRRLAGYLRDRFAQRTELEIVAADAVQFDTRTLYPLQPVHLIGNLPYSAGGEIIRNFLGPHSPVSAAVLMLQREFAARITASPGTKAYGPLSVRVQARWRVETLKHIGPEAFHPRPQIDSTVIRLTPHPVADLPPHDPALFDSLVRRGFSQRRKQMRKSLGIEPGPWEALSRELGVAPTVRAEELHLAQWFALARLLDDHPLKDLPQSGEELFDVVDENDVVLDRKPRAQVHREGLRHRAVHIFVLNKAGHLLLQKRSRLKDVHPGAWDSSAAGHLDAGETYAAAAVRELKEELDLESALEPVARIAPSEATGQEFVELFLTRATGKPRWPSSEIEQALYFPVPLIETWIETRPQDFATGFLECWKAWRNTPPPA